MIVVAMMIVLVRLKLSEKCETLQISTTHSDFIGERCDIIYSLSSINDKAQSTLDPETNFTFNFDKNTSHNHDVQLFGFN